MSAKVLIIGFGNPGRRDDGLGPALAAAVEAMAIDGVAVEAAYQLGIEDAAEAAAYETVIFADAHATCTEPFVFERLEPTGRPGFTTHAVSPGSVLALAREMFESEVEGFILGIRGEDCESFAEELTPAAARNLAAAAAFIEPVLRKRDFTGGVTVNATGPGHPATGEGTAESDE